MKAAIVPMWQPILTAFWRTVSCGKNKTHFETIKPIRNTNTEKISFKGSPPHKSVYKIFKTVSNGYTVKKHPISIKKTDKSGHS